MTQRDIYRRWPWFLEAVDIPSMMMGGSSAGFFLSGMGSVLFAGLIEAPEGCIWCLNAVLIGVLLITISLAIAGLMALYWWFVTRKHGASCPEFNGFVSVSTALSFFSAIMMSLSIGYSIGGPLGQ